jgi:hypothetical protein
MRYDFDFDDVKENYPTEFTERMRMRFIEICNTILTSDNQQLVNKLYDILFTEYRMYIIESHPIIKVSCFEEVIVKLLNDEEKNLYEDHGISTSPFMRYLALIKESEMKQRAKHHSYRTMSNGSEISKINPKSYLFMFVAGHNDKIKNQTIRRLIHQYFSEM